MPRSKKLNAVQRAYANDENLLLLIEQLKDGCGNSGLSYSSNADKKVAMEMAAEIKRQIALSVASGAIDAVGIIYRATNVSITSDLVIEIAAIRKETGRRKKDFPNSLNKAVIRPVIDRGGLVFQVLTVSLVLDPDARNTPRLSTAGTAQSAALPSDQWTANPTEAEIARLVERFGSAAGDLRRMASLVARNSDQALWNELRQDAIVKTWQIDVSTPTKKLFLAFGIGVEVLKHALTGPEAWEKRVGKNGISRDQVVHAIWRHALVNSRHAPPLIKL